MDRVINLKVTDLCFAFQEYEDNLFLQCDKCRMMVCKILLLDSHKLSNLEVVTNALQHDAGSC